MKEKKKLPKPVKKGKIDMRIILSPEEQRDFQQLVKAFKTKPISDVTMGPCRRLRRPRSEPELVPEESAKPSAKRKKETSMAKKKTKAELEKENQELRERLEALEQRVDHVEKQSAPRPRDRGPIVVKYGTPDGPRAHLLLFPDKTALIVPSEEAVNLHINDSSKDQPTEIWEMKQRTITSA